MKTKAKTNKTRLGFLGKIMCTHEQAYVRSKIMCTRVSTQKP